MESSPMKKMGYGKGKLAGLPAINGKGKSESAPKVMKGAREAGEKYKAPKAGMNAISRKADTKSSGNVTMKPQSASDKNRYTQAKQPAQFTNLGQKATKFLC